MLVSEENVTQKAEQRTLTWLCGEVGKHGFCPTVHHVQGAVTNAIGNPEMANMDVT